MFRKILAYAVWLHSPLQCLDAVLKRNPKYIPVETDLPGTSSEVMSLNDSFKIREPNDLSELRAVYEVCKKCDEPGRRFGRFFENWDSKSTKERMLVVTRDNIVIGFMIYRELTVYQKTTYRIIRLLIDPDYDFFLPANALVEHLKEICKQNKYHMSAYVSEEDSDMFASTLR